MSERWRRVRPGRVLTLPFTLPAWALLLCMPTACGSGPGDEPTAGSVEPLLQSQAGAVFMKRPTLDKFPVGASWTFGLDATVIAAKKQAQMGEASYSNHDLGALVTASECQSTTHCFACGFITQGGVDIGTFNIDFNPAASKWTPLVIDVSIVDASVSINLQGQPAFFFKKDPNAAPPSGSFYIVGHYDGQGVVPTGGGGYSTGIAIGRFLFERP